MTERKLENVNKVLLKFIKNIEVIIEKYYDDKNKTTYIWSSVKYPRQNYFIYREEKCRFKKFPDGTGKINFFYNEKEWMETMPEYLFRNYSRIGDYIGLFIRGPINFNKLDDVTKKDFHANKQEIYKERNKRGGKIYSPFNKNFFYYYYELDNNDEITNFKNYDNKNEWTEKTYNYRGFYRQFSA